jgi:hypothetical protein
MSRRVVYELLNPAVLMLWTGEVATGAPAPSLLAESRVDVSFNQGGGPRFVDITPVSIGPMPGGQSLCSRV